MNRTNGLLRHDDEKPKARKRARPAAKRKAKLTPHQHLALAVAGVGCFVLTLSVWECTSALQALTGMPLVLAGMLAVGIDMGMVVCEAAAIASEKGKDARWWAEWYVWLAVGLSVILNAAAAVAHATGWMVFAAAPVGGVVPVFVYLAGRVAGALWAGK